MTTDWLLRAFADDRAQAAGAYRRYVAAGMDAPSPWLGLKNQIYLGSDQFVERALAMLDPKQPLTEIPRRQRRPQAKALQYYAEHFGVGRMTVSRAENRYRVETKTACCAMGDLTPCPWRWLAYVLEALPTTDPADYPALLPFDFTDRFPL